MKKLFATLSAAAFLFGVAGATMAQSTTKQAPIQIAQGDKMEKKGGKMEGKKTGGKKTGGKKTGGKKTGGKKTGGKKTTTKPAPKKGDAPKK